jgi:Domain of unknown function (DUF4118)
MVTPFLVASLAVCFAAVLQEVLAAFGTTLYFAAFIPAIVVASLLAGAPAGTFAAVLSIPVVWWTFMPPYFEFNPLTAADYDRFAIFSLSSALVICFCQLYREALVVRARLGKHP